MDTANLIADLKDAEGYITAAAFLADHMRDSQRNALRALIEAAEGHLHEAMAELRKEGSDHA
jgi:predicted amino acid dehydrogenase